MNKATMPTALLKARYVFQDDTDAKHKNRFKPCLLTDEGIEYLGFVIELSRNQKRQLEKNGCVNTSYGLFSFNKLSWIDYYLKQWEEITGKNDESFDLVLKACAMLGLNYPYDQGDVKTAYRQQAKQHHPDMGGSPERFRAIQEAYELLMESAL